jgi:hypothetical protein
MRDACGSMTTATVRWLRFIQLQGQPMPTSMTTTTCPTTVPSGLAGGAPRRTLRSRRAFLALLLAAPLPAIAASDPRDATKVEMWKEKSCGCCGDWVRHLQGNGFVVAIHDTGNTAMRARLGLPAELGSCHTALVGGYAIEGHVPARDVQRLLKDRPAAIGLAVPGMPVGSPGMDGPAYNGRRDPYDVLLVARDGRTSVYRAVR